MSYPLHCRSLLFELVFLTTFRHISTPLHVYNDPVEVCIPKTFFVNFCGFVLFLTIKFDTFLSNEFTYLGSIIKPEGGTKEDIHSRLGKARRVFREMNNVWRSTQYSVNTKLKLYQSCVHTPVWIWMLEDNRD